MLEAALVMAAVGSGGLVILLATLRTVPLSGPYFGTRSLKRGMTSRAKSSIEWRHAFGFSE